MNPIEHIKGKGFYIYDDDRNIIAELTYLERENKILVFDHTYVSEVLQGQGIAGKLLDEASNYSRENGYKVQAVCSYVVAKFRDKKYDDINFCK